MNKNIQKAMLLTFATFSLFNFNSSVWADSHISVGNFLEDKVEQTISPFSRVKNKVRSKFAELNGSDNVSRKNSDKYANMPYRQTSSQPYNQPYKRRHDSQNQQVQANNQIEPYISPIRTSPQAQISQEDLNLWVKPVHVSYSDWNQITNSTRRASKKTGIPERLILSLINQESGFNSRAVSKSGAMGLTQLMPATAIIECGVQARELFGIDVNIQCGASYLEKQIKIFRKLDLAIAAYNAGPGAVRRAVEKAGTDDIEIVTSLLKEETAPYVDKILTKINYGDDFI